MQVIQNILQNYESDSPGVKRNLASILLAGKLGGTGKMVILPVDQGFEHGPARSFATNAESYDPHYHFQLAIDAGLSAYAAPLGMLEAGADSFAGRIPLILKMNNANSLTNSASVEPSQAITATVDDALRLGCSAIGFTIYPGSDNAYYMMEDFKELAAEAKAKGLAVIIWSYARGSSLSKDDETALDVIAYSAHIAALLGGHIIKVKPPTAYIAQKAAQKAYAGQDFEDLSCRIAHIKQAAFNGRRLVVFSGGASKDEASLLQEIQALHAGGADGSIIGRNSFQRPREEALHLLNAIISIYANQSKQKLIDENT